MRSYPYLLESGEAVVATEKIHGCLTYKTKISMWGRGYKPIHKIEVGEFIVGINVKGEVVPSKVLNKFNNGSAEKWLNVRGKRRLFGSGNSINVDSSKWDLETETHNFFTNSILVHNSNCRVGFVWHTDEEQPTMMAGSRTLRRREPEPTVMVTNTYWFPHTLIGVKNLLADLQTQGHKQAILYGEVYGQGIQAYTYGEKRMNFRAFDLMLDGKYVDYPIFQALCDRHQVEQVPLVYDGAFSLDIIKGFSDGDSLIGGNHGREGVVVKPRIDRDDPKFGRVILKYIGDRYLFGKVAEQDTTDV